MLQARVGARSANTLSQSACSLTEGLSCPEFPAGEGDMDAQSEGEHGMPATSSELAAIHEEIRELRQLVVAALGQLPGGTSAVKTR